MVPLLLLPMALLPLVLLLLLPMVFLLVPLVFLLVPLVPLLLVAEKETENQTRKDEVKRRRGRTESVNLIKTPSNL
jgi:hypothetical protein